MSNSVQSWCHDIPAGVWRSITQYLRLTETCQLLFLTKLISKIELSLKDIDYDFYGYCETCGVEIGIKRLEARPTATKCIDCKTVDEIKEKQQFG